MTKITKHKNSIQIAERGNTVSPMGNIKQLSFFFLMFILSVNLSAQNRNTITISGHVADFDGNPIDSSVVRLLHKDFSIAYETYSNKTGHYMLENIEKGKYMALYAIRLKEYPQENAVKEEDMRLEFWAWNVIADTDLVINPRYHRLELYGFQVFEVLGGSPYLMAYVRPMSLGKYIDIANNGKSDISVKLEDIEFKLYAGNEPLTVHSVQSLIEYEGEGNQTMRAFFLQFDRPKEFSSSDCCIFRIEATHNAFGIEKGENLYFYELKNYK